MFHIAFYSRFLSFFPQLVQGHFCSVLGNGNGKPDDQAHCIPDYLDLLLDILVVCQPVSSVSVCVLGEGGAMQYSSLSVD